MCIRFDEVQAGTFSVSSLAAETVYRWLGLGEGMSALLSKVELALSTAATAPPLAWQPRLHIFQ